MKSSFKPALRNASAAAILLCALSSAAFYNPNTGRWVSRDPIEEKDGPNLYTCARNGPLNFIDNLGRNCLDPCGFAKAMGWDIGPDGSRASAGVVCCGGKKYTCIYKQPIAVGKAKEIILGCMFDHEQSHFPQIEDCPKCVLWPTRTRFHPIVDPNQAECQVYDLTMPIRLVDIYRAIYHSWWS